MSELTRFGVSLDAGLLRRFDALIERKGYSNRSEALRDLIRDQLVAEKWRTDPEEAMAVVTLVYDHHDMDLPKRLTRAQHDRHDLIVSTLHIHMTHHACLEVIVLRGKGSAIKKLGDRLTSTRGVVHGKVTLTTTGRELD